MEGGSAIFRLIGAPTAGRVMNVRMKVPQQAFSIGTEVFLIPTRSVISFATFLAMEERGEELSEKSQLYLDRHNAELEREIERDADGEQGYMQLKNLEGTAVSNMTAGYY